MANSIGAVTKHLVNIAEQLYGHESISAILDTPNPEFIDAQTIKVPRMTTSGLGDYSKTNGYTTGDLNLAWVPYTLTKDRGKRFVLDAVENMDAAGKALAMMEGTFIKSNVVPEIDAYRFAAYANGAASANKKSADLDETSVLPAIDTAREALFEAGVPENNLILFVSPSCYTALMNAADKLRISEGEVLNRKVKMLDEVPVVKVPSSRFVDKITLGTNGYTIPTGSKAINFLLMDKGAVMQVVKHNPSNLISPDANQTADGWIYKFRIFHDALVQDGKDVGIYAHTVASAKA